VPASPAIAGERFDLLVDAFAPCPPTHIFNSPDFFRLHATERGARGRYFQLAERKSGDILAVMHFTETVPGCYRSPARGTFGGLSAPGDLSLEQIEFFANAAEDVLRADGASQLQIAMPPASHDLALHAKCFNVFARRSFGVVGQEINYDMPVTAEPLASRMDYGNRKRLNKCLREGFVTARLDADRYVAAYNLIADNRRRKGYPITMDLPSIMAMVDLFGDRMQFFGTMREGVLAAAAVCIAVSTKVMSVFYWGDGDGMQEYSPVVPLAAAIYAHCQAEGFSILDTGIGTDAGKPNHGLMRFKRSLGFRESPKLTMGKDILPHA
jgi:hypothetical protein